MRISQLEQLSTHAALREVAEMLARCLEARDVAPDYEFEAHAGREYGDVQEWSLGAGAPRLLRYGDGGGHTCILADACNDPDELATWLLHPDLDGVEALHERAMVYGLDSAQVPAAAEGCEGPCLVLSESDYLDGTHRVDIHDASERGDYDWARPQPFASYAEAQAWIAEVDAGTYHLSHNESGRPTHKIIEA